MSHHRGWHPRQHDGQYQDDRYYGHFGSNYLGYGNSYVQPYAHDSNGYYWTDAQPGQAYNYWRDNAYYAPHPYQSSTNYGLSHQHAVGDYPAERSYRQPWRQRQRSHSPHRQYHTRAEIPDPSAPYVTPPSFRWRTPDPTPHPPTPQTKSPPPPPPAEPDPAYMTLSSEPSHILDDPRASRKLLILDLNGTLLIRSQNNHRARQDNTGQPPRMRAVQPRPYIPSFRAYLFAPETLEWLDTMVWSSAQPHSVTDMVDKVFDDCKSKLVAVWNRDSLGLSKKDYFRKAQTTKDLTKPWTLLPLDTGLAKLAPSVAHSAMTTLLLDDSTAKARLQPYNHVCIPEYNSSLRARDLERYEKMKDNSVPLTDNELAGEGPRSQKQKKRKPKAQKQPAQPLSEQISSLSSSDSDLSVVDSTTGAVEQSSILPTERARISSRPVETYDPTLLAVIGILDEIKKQSCVAGWIRAGGLLDVVAALPAAKGEATASKDLTPATGRAAKKLAKKESQRVAKQLAETQLKGAEKGTSYTGFPAHNQTGNDGSSTSVSGAPPNSGMWFSDENTLDYWVGRGCSALEKLGIEVAHGVTK